MAWVVFYFSAFLFLHSSCSGLLANNHNAFIDGGNPGRPPGILRTISALVAALIICGLLLDQTGDENQPTGENLENNVRSILTGMLTQTGTDWAMFNEKAGGAFYTTREREWFTKCGSEVKGNSSISDFKKLKCSIVQEKPFRGRFKQNGRERLSGDGGSESVPESSEEPVVRENQGDAHAAVREAEMARQVEAMRETLLADLADGHLEPEALADLEARRRTFPEFK